jgi:3-oxoacyl-[acyl-carrier protein] reductase
MDLGLDGHTVIVTGASGGIGRHIARRFAAEGADVVLTYNTSADVAREAADKLAADFGNRATALRFDLADTGSAHALAEAVLAWSGRIDVLVNNAVLWGATTPDSTGAFEDAPEEAWLRVLRTNVEGTLRLSRLVAPHMRGQGWGRLVHVSSSIAVDGMAGGEYYGAAKAALHGFSRSVAFSLGRDGDILSNVVLPGLTRTETNTHIVESVPAEYAERFAAGRLLDADEIAGPIVYLGSAANTGITGQDILVRGG